MTTDQFIDKHIEEMLDDLKTLVRIPSMRGEAGPGQPYGAEPARVLAAAGEMMERYGFAVKNYDNYVVTGDLNDKEKELDILAHLDVVPVTEDWTVTQPFEPKIVGNRIYGRGTADDKGPAIAALYAMRAIKECGIELKKNVRLILGSDEECGSGDLEHYYQIEAEAPASFTPDADFPLINLEKGRLAKSFAAEFDQAAARPFVKEFHGGDKVNVVPANAQAVVCGISKEEIERAIAETAKAPQSGQVAAKVAGTPQTGQTIAEMAKAPQSGQVAAKVAGTLQSGKDSGQDAKTDAAVTFTLEEAGADIRISAKGLAAHASTPDAGKNAVCALLELLVRLPLGAGAQKDAFEAAARLFPYGDTAGGALGVAMKDEISGALTLNLGIVDYDGKTFRGTFDSRVPVCGTDENVTEVIREKLKENGFTMEEGRMTPPHYVPEDSPLVQTLLSSYEKYTGIKGKPLAIGGGTYVHELKRGVAFGCMTDDVDNHMHGDDEFMVIDVLVMSAKIFADAICRLCG